MKIQLKWVYVAMFYVDLPIFRYIPLPFAKAGNAAVVDSRMNSITVSLRRFVVPLSIRRVWAVPSFSWSRIEKATHWTAQHWRCEWLKGMSGWTEVFFTFNLASGLLAYYFLSGCQIENTLILSLVIMGAPLPFDLILYTTFYWAVTTALLLLFLYIAVWVLWCIGMAGVSFL